MTHLFTLSTILLAASSKKSSSSGSVTFLIFIVVVVAALYFLFLRPNQQRAKRQREQNASISVGDRVVSIGGIVGLVERMEDDRVVLAVGLPAPGAGDGGARIEVLRSAISRKLEATAPVVGDEAEEAEADDEVDEAPERAPGADGSGRVDDPSTDADSDTPGTRKKAEGETGA